MATTDVTRTATIADIANSETRAEVARLAEERAALRVLSTEPRGQTTTTARTVAARAHTRALLGCLRRPDGAEFCHGRRSLRCRDPDAGRSAR